MERDGKRISKWNKFFELNLQLLVQSMQNGRFIRPQVLFLFEFSTIMVLLKIILSLDYLKKMFSNFLPFCNVICLLLLLKVD